MVLNECSCIVLLNILNKFGKNIRCEALLSIISVFSKELNKFNNTGAGMQVYINHNYDTKIRSSLRFSHKKIKILPLLPLLTNHHLPLLTRGKVYSSCVRSVMLHAAETWAMKVDTLNRLRRNDRAMIRWICNVRAKDEVSSDSPVG